jgi:hypothetical protein
VTVVVNTTFNMGLLDPEGSSKVPSGDETLQIVAKSLTVAHKFFLLAVQKNNFIRVLKLAKNIFNSYTLTQKGL